MRVCNHGCDDKDVLLFVRLLCQHEFEKVFELKIQQAYSIYPFPCQLKLRKSLQNMMCQFFSLKLTF